MSNASHVDQAIDALLTEDEDASGPRPRRVVVEHVLTTGYAEVLDLEAERLRLLRQLEGAPASEDPTADEVADYRAALATVDGRLGALRKRLAEVNRRFGAPV
jgi:hypothetical protein